MSSGIGRIFRVTTFGESHGVAVGCVIDGCPPRLPLTPSDIQKLLNRRRPGQSALTTSRDEKDRVTILSGVEKGITLGSPIALSVSNTDVRAEDYDELHRTPRPSHADYTYEAKYGIRARSGGGRSSARETIGRVAAGAVADQLLRLAFGVRIVAWVSAVGKVTARDRTKQPPTRDEVDTHSVRAPDADSAARMKKAIASARRDRNSVGGIITCVCQGVPPGWGEPVFDKLPAVLGQAMLSIPAVKGIEIGSGFQAARRLGSQQNDMFLAGPHGLRTKTNRSGGVQGGISNGAPIVFRVAFKPPATIGLPQSTVDFDGHPVCLEIRGRHDPCVVPRAVPIVEAMAALVLADAALCQSALETVAAKIDRRLKNERE